MYATLPTEDEPSTAAAVDVRRRMEEEYERCTREGLPVFVLALEVLDLDRIVEEHPGSSSKVMRALLELLDASLHGKDLYAYLSGDRIIAMLPAIPAAVVDVSCRQIIADAKKLVVDGTAEPLRTLLSIGLARTQKEGTLLFETLVLVAQEGVTVAYYRGGGCCVHTMLYGLMQAEAERLLHERSQPAPPTSPTEDFVALPRKPRLEPLPTTRRERKQPFDQEELRATLQRMIEQEVKRRPESSAMQSRLREMADNLAAQAIDSDRRPEERKPPANSEEVDRLERRITKLVQQLEETERRLAQTSATGNVQAGVSSVYRSIQGLRGSERDYELKMSLMRELLAANLELQRSRPVELSARFSDESALATPRT